MRYWIAPILMLVMAGCGSDSPPQLRSETPTQQNAAPTGVNLTLSPVSTYATHCLVCHRAIGEVPLRRQGEELREIVGQMVRLNARMKNASDADVEAMTAYVKALDAHQPFAAIVNGQSVKNKTAESVVLEATPESNIIVDGAAISAGEKGQATLPAPNSESFTVTVEANEKKATFEFPQQQWTKVD